MSEINGLKPKLSLGPDGLPPLLFEGLKYLIVGYNSWYY